MKWIRFRIKPSETPGDIRLTDRLKVEAAQKLPVISRENPNRKARLICDDAGERPAVDHLTRIARPVRNWQLPIIAENKAVPGIKQRERPALPKIQRIQNAFKA